MSMPLHAVTGWKTIIQQNCIKTEQLLLLLLKDKDICKVQERQVANGSRHNSIHMYDTYFIFESYVLMIRICYFIIRMKR